MITTATTGITVSAANTDAVVIRGLTINGVNPDGSNSANYGIYVASVGRLSIQNCVINGGPSGLVYAPNYATSEQGLLTVNDSTIRNAANVGIFLTVSGTGSAAVAIDHVRLEGNRIGIASDTGSIAEPTIKDSVITGSGTYAVLNSAGDLSGSKGSFSVVNCAIVNNKSGLVVDGASRIFVSNTIITGNNIGLARLGTGGILVSSGNNLMLNLNFSQFDGVHSLE